MAEAPDMLSVAVMSRPLSQIIAWGSQQPVSYGEFLDRTRAWQRLLTRISGQSFALTISDAAEFAAALFGAWQAKKTIYLPGDRLPHDRHAGARRILVQCAVHRCHGRS